MQHTPETKNLVQQVVDSLRIIQEWEQDAMTVAHMMGLQGEKRRNSYENTETFALIKHFSKKMYDIFEEITMPTNMNTSFPKIDNCMQYFETYLKKVETSYMDLHNLYNKLVQHNMLPVAKMLEKKIKRLFKYVEATNRMMKYGKLTNWSYDYILLSQQKVHDKFKEKEKRHKHEHDKHC